MPDPSGSDEYAPVDKGLILDLFAGPGGWSEGLRMLDPVLAHEELGVELDPQAVATRTAAGFTTLQNRSPTGPSAMDASRSSSSWVVPRKAPT